MNRYMYNVWSILIQKLSINQSKQTLSKFDFQSLKSKNKIGLKGINSWLADECLLFNQKFAHEQLFILYTCAHRAGGGGAILI